MIKKITAMSIIIVMSLSINSSAYASFNMNTEDFNMNNWLQSISNSIWDKIDNIDISKGKIKWKWWTISQNSEKFLKEKKINKIIRWINKIWELERNVKYFWSEEKKNEIRNWIELLQKANDNVFEKVDWSDVLKLWNINDVELKDNVKKTLLNWIMNKDIPKWYDWIHSPWNSKVYKNIQKRIVVWVIPSKLWNLQKKALWETCKFNLCVKNDNGDLLVYAWLKPSSIKKEKQGQTNDNNPIVNIDNTIIAKDPVNSGIAGYCWDWTLQKNLWEECDDWNNNNWDWCSATCSYELPNCNVIPTKSIIHKWDTNTFNVVKNNYSNIDKLVVNWETYTWSSFTNNSINIPFNNTGVYYTELTMKNKYNSWTINTCWIYTNVLDTSKNIPTTLPWNTAKCYFKSWDIISKTITENTFTFNENSPITILNWDDNNLNYIEYWDNNFTTTGNNNINFKYVIPLWKSSRDYTITAHLKNWNTCSTDLFLQKKNNLNIQDVMPSCNDNDAWCQEIPTQNVCWYKQGWTYNWKTISKIKVKYNEDISNWSIDWKLAVYLFDKNWNLLTWFNINEDTNSKITFYKYWDYDYNWLPDWQSFKNIINDESWFEKILWFVWIKNEDMIDNIKKAYSQIWFTEATNPLKYPLRKNVVAEITWLNNNITENDINNNLISKLLIKYNVSFNWNSPDSCTVNTDTKVSQLFWWKGTLKIMNWWEHTLNNLYAVWLIDNKADTTLNLPSLKTVYYWIIDKSNNNLTLNTPLLSEIGKKWGEAIDFCQVANKYGYDNSAMPKIHQALWDILLHKKYLGLYFSWNWNINWNAKRLDDIYWNVVALKNISNFDTNAVNSSSSYYYNKDNDYFSIYDLLNKRNFIQVWDTTALYNDLKNQYGNSLSESQINSLIWQYTNKCSDTYFRYKVYLASNPYSLKQINYMINHNLYKWELFLTNNNNNSNFISKLYKTTKIFIKEFNNNNTLDFSILWLIRWSIELINSSNNTINLPNLVAWNTTLWKRYSKDSPLILTNSSNNTINIWNNLLFIWTKLPSDILFK